ncbi:MAG: hypothetical protein JSR54_13470 [Proteobacteria bacterium]|nr:hypothetical protein [Pseudomonadota bacterium]
MRALLLFAALLPGVAIADEPAAADERPEPAVIAPLAARSLLLDVRTLPDGHLVTVGERGHVLVSRDAGASWLQSPVPVRATLTSVYFADALHGWAVGHDETILRTVDGGARWILVHYAPEHEQPLLAVWFDSTGHGFAVGAYSTVYRSDDAGATWRNVPFAARPLPAPDGHGAPAKVARQATYEDMRADAWTLQPHLTSISADAGGRLYVTAEAGHLYRSDDGGGTWLELTSPYEGSFFGSLPLEGDSVLAFGLRGHLYRSDDGGRHWQRLSVATEALLAGATRLADGTIVIAGLEGVVLVSRDGGHSFAVHQEADRKSFDAVSPAPGGVVVCGEAGVRRLSLAELAPRG